jgi:alpha-tubulin suppressor-like RCC1 family protein
MSKFFLEISTLLILKTRFGQLGNGSKLNSILPVVVNSTGFGNGKIQQISCGYQHTCATLNDHRIFCWGKNSFIKKNINFFKTIINIWLAKVNLVQET